MTPEANAPQPQQQSFLSKNWPWLVGGGCLALMCCGFFGLMGAGFIAASAEKDRAKQEAEKTLRDMKEDQDAMNRAREGSRDPLPPGKGGATAARVDCGTPGPEGVDCTVKRTGGTSALDACWDLEIDCVNGGKMTGNACGSLGAGEQTGTVTMPVEAFSNQEGCDAPKFGKVTNLVVTEQ